MNDLEEIKCEIRKIKTFLYDDSEVGSEGLVSKVDRVEKKLDTVINDLRWSKNVAMGIGAVVSFIVTTLINYFSE